MPRVLGIDPGSRATGFGVVDGEGAQLVYRGSGVIRTGSGDLPERLRQIFEGVSAVIAEQTPDYLAVEQVFVQRNVSTALKLGQARGTAICAGAIRGLPIHEYSPRAVKLALTGTGTAAKDQVQMMVRHLLGLHGQLQEDASDALAIALCHLQQSRLGIRTQTALASQWGRKS